MSCGCVNDRSRPCVNCGHGRENHTKIGQDSVAGVTEDALCRECNCGAFVDRRGYNRRNRGRRRYGRRWIFTEGSVQDD